MYQFQASPYHDTQIVSLADSLFIGSLDLIMVICVERSNVQADMSDRPQAEEHIRQNADRRFWHNLCYRAEIDVAEDQAQSPEYKGNDHPRSAIQE